MRSVIDFHAYSDAVLFGGALAMTLQDAVLALLLAAKIHGTDRAVKATAKRCAKQLPRSKRGIVLSIAVSAEPLKLVRYIADNLE
ncbi:hypothetical protein [Pseudomonas aeruginosa]|uniref:DUF7740 domain-containing protein n=1 Tax=Pseudomonas aeruginosa TaxID=287 RepID=UPI002AAB5BC8|nr:hypothetical protein [Pseudomonas aeruginosa]